MAEAAALRQCKVYGGEDQSKFSGVMPAIGMYIAIASFVCAACIWGDLLRVIHRNKFWVASKYYALNAATLTILGVATKVPTDISGSMPGLWDQFAKLSGIVTMCVAVSHAMPSFGTMDDAAALSNLVALAILVITVCVNVWIQISSGLIELVRVWCIVYTLELLTILQLVTFKFLTAKSAKKVLEGEYNKKLQRMLEEGSTNYPPRRIEKLRELVGKYWLMALSCSPRTPLYGYIIDVSAMFTSGALGFVYIVWALKMTIHGRSGCYIKSDYKWSITLILILQLVAAIGSVVEIILCYIHIFRAYQRRPLFPFTVSLHRNIQLLWELGSAPLPFRFRCKQVRKVAYAFKAICLFLFSILMYALITVFTLIEWASKSSSRFLTPLSESLTSIDNPTPMVGLGKNEDFRAFVIPQGELEQEEEQVQEWLHIIQRWIKMGQNNKPRELHALLKTHDTITEQDPPPCWSLMLATLATITRATSGPISKAVDQGFQYVEFVDKNIHEEGARPDKSLAAGMMVWDNLSLSDKWLGQDLNEVESINDFAKIIHFFKAKADNFISYFFSEFDMESLSMWPLEVIAAKCMYEITTKISNLSVVSHGGIVSNTNNYDLGWLQYMAWLINKGRSWLFNDVNHETTPEFRSIDHSLNLPRYVVPSNVNSPQKLQEALLNIMGECLRNIPRAILTHCYSGRFCDREEKVREAAQVLGEVEDILVWLGYEACADMHPTAEPNREDVHLQERV